ncbi:MAG: hypothetical protein WCQ55_00545 [Paludibacteraceae bacterium]|nr:hypothetical protein [Prevotellaceae bacterium]
MADLFQKLKEKRRQLSSQLKDPAAAGVWKMVVDKYSDQAHFLYELLQNADDAAASYVRIHLFSDRLVFIHDGSIHFSISDVEQEESGAEIGHLNAITSIGASSKHGGNKIGKFGVGFKSVFQYTDTPHIEDDNFSFHIVDFIVPEEEEPVVSDRKCGETLFSIPFRNPAVAFGEIVEKLKVLNKPLLFLHSLNSIKWDSHDGQVGFYTKESTVGRMFGNTEYAFVVRHWNCNNETGVEYLHNFSRNLSPLNGDAQMGTVAFLSDEKGRLLISKMRENAFCFFSTKERTDLNMIVHAPFLLTDSREGIKRGEEWNRYLIDQLARLAADSVEYLCQIGDHYRAPIIDDNLFDLVPMDRSCFFKKEKDGYVPISPFHPFYDRFVEKLSTGRVFLSADGSYVDRVHTRYATDKALIPLFPTDKYAEMTKNVAELSKSWTFLSLYEDADAGHNARLHNILSYIHDNGLISTLVTPDTIVDGLNGDFMKCQDLDWLKDFYAYLISHGELLEKKGAVIRNKPFILCSDGSVAAPYQPDGSSALFLSGGMENKFLSVHPELLGDDRCKRLFSMLGLTHPGLFAEIELYTIGKYRDGLVDISDREAIYRNLNSFVECFSSFNFMDDRRNNFVALFDGVPIFPTVDKRGVPSFCSAADVYVDIPDLKAFLANVQSVHFLDKGVVEEAFLPEKRESFYKFASALGANFSLKIVSVSRNADQPMLDKLGLSPKSLRQYDNGAQIIKDKEIAGFSDFGRNITRESSEAFFNLLSDLIQRQSSYMFQLSLEGDYRYVERARQNYTEEKIHHTTAWHSIFSEPWIFNLHGDVVRPSDIGSVNNLSGMYDISSPDILFFLGISGDSSLSGLTPEQRRAVLVVRAFEESGVSVEMLEEKANCLRKEKDKGGIPSGMSSL